MKHMSSLKASHIRRVHSTSQALWMFPIKCLQSATSPPLFTCPFQNKKLIQISGMNEVYSLCALIVSSISFLINAYLLLIYFHCPLKKVEWCKYFFLLAGIQDIILSLTIILAIPIPVAGEFSVVFLATGPIHSPGSGEALLDLYCMMFITSWLLTANSFFFRYLQVCRRDLFQRCLSKTSVAVVIAVNIALLTQWAAAVHVAFYPTSEFIAANAHMVDMWTGLNSSECAQLGYSRKYSPSVVTNILIFIVSIYMAAVESLAVYSAIKIAKTLRQSTYSACLRKRHWQIFTLLLLQLHLLT
ncbi:hypothetical protein Q1695_006538 [Nippostrongylus brasiliensis]|nr:hypothetical protein Q1695_006538 [Nippostrongylus brasiliensis]